MTKLSERQRQALDAYRKLMAERPTLFAGRHARPIVRDCEALSAYALDHDMVLGVAAVTPTLYFVIDLVESRLVGGGEHIHPYLRIVSRGKPNGGTNVVVLATIEEPSLGRRGDIVLVEQERHALGTKELELPRGFGEAGQSEEANALRELQEETGYVGECARPLGSTCTDSGLTDEVVSFFHVPVVRRTAQLPELEEAIGDVRLATKDEVWRQIRSGVIRDSFTLQALALFENTL